MTSDSTAKAKRSEAADARRLAPLFPLDSDRENLLRHAKELEGEADALDLQAAGDEQREPERQESERQEPERQEPERQEAEAQADVRGRRLRDDE